MADSTTSYSVELSHVLQDLKEKFKHGEHITRILEGQLDTAQQNISLLQGQVRLANETIDNLKQQFKSSENAVFFLLENGDRIAKDLSLKVNINERQDQCNHSHEYNSQDDQVPSPKSVIILQKDGTQEYIMSSSNNSSQNNGEKPKSPYAQQLRQVLDILQNEEPTKKNSGSSSNACQSVGDDYQPSCHCPECSGVSSHRQTSTSGHAMCKSLSCTCSYHMSHSNQQNDREKTKMMVPWCSSPKVNSDMDLIHSNGDMRIGSTTHKGSRDPHMNGRMSPRGSLVNHSSQCGCPPSSEHHSKYNMVERNHASSCHYTVSCADTRMHHNEDNSSQRCKTPCQGEECSEGCSCHPYPSYGTPYGYQVLDSASATQHVIRAVTSPGKKRKRLPTVIQIEDPPHLKYTKVKRIDGSKLTAQKTIADFSKRRYLPCNPRFDLDLLIVPPPLSAAELLGASSDHQIVKQPMPPQHHTHSSNSSSQNGGTPLPPTIVEVDEDKIDSSNSVFIQDTFPQSKGATSIGTASPASNASYTNDDVSSGYPDNNNMQSDRDRTINKSPICDITASKLPHFINPRPPSLPTKS